MHDGMQLNPLTLLAQRLMLGCCPAKATESRQVTVCGRSLQWSSPMPPPQPNHSTSLSMFFEFFKAPSTPTGIPKSTPDPRGDSKINP